ncbi:HAD-IA family hydrolase [Shewanella sp. SHSM-M6]|uniref:HAD-IA family hydrolase n=2 Tax=Shewanella salipaludis TaxID=2723052 RepID=A0A972FQ60_9GAMM|nr:HAD-IA family hydrolase [Shewanella salipaludis]
MGERRQGYELVIFDWDGTLMDSVGKIVACMARLALELARPVPSEAAIRDIIGLSMTKALAQLFPHETPQVYRQMQACFRQHYLELDTTPSPLFEGSRDLLVQLKARGYRLAIATGKGRQGLERVLQETGLGEYFDASRCADEAESKPHPQMLQQLLHQLRLGPEQAIMVGDSVHDLFMAKHAGMDAIGVSYGAHSAAQLRGAGPKAIIDSAGELLAHL